jgi:pimeloyl-ACP methyl ester carboxylesterase
LQRRQHHVAIAQCLPQGRHLLAETSSHWIMQDQPDLVIGAIRAVAQSFNATGDSGFERSFSPRGKIA